MLDYIRGTLIELEPNFAVIETGGWGLRLTISLHTYNRIKTMNGQEIKLYTYMIIKEETIELIGFFDILERRAFMLLNRVSGIGPKAAISILSLIDVAKLKACILSEDVKTLVSVPGIGKKTAQKIIIDLKDSVKDLPVEAGKSESGDALYEAREVLMSLGFNPGEIQLALIDNTGNSVEEIVTKALKKLSR
ncbi:Holliday junction branch migration protein RuvA [Thermoanaerobacterium sp. DL9XJH110]|uniref:Holliday junction branch migration protein RuvA n=1 Tax=Thermoanaerobacterium sp. DL9XJH110 TaxID=3386643 RepID=UPI003BB5701A